MRLADAILDDCLCDPAAPLARDPARCYSLDKAQAQAQLTSLKDWLRVQQTMLWANRRDALLLVLQGPDCSGKNGVIRRVLGGLDPIGLSPHSFQAPSAEERRQDFLRRYRERLPAPGMLGVFNRSYYEALVSDLRDGLCTPTDIPQRQSAIQAFEHELPATGIQPLKCYLQLSASEQKQRLHRRLEQPEKRWKLTLGDLRDHRNFAQQQAQWAEVLSNSHSLEAPWYVIPADHRWLRDLLVASLLAREFERMALTWPTHPAPFTHADLDSTP
ncbi:MAG: hypothetical protein CVV19_12760 [Gammaproteobacteria bacterium HGW-Gammaproteobacteria-9]|nr:MAG: hypothetical protein CVV19_12760 [Gammaproteobacteria bacterium HGW-Gammaproteobacteria-9]